MALNRKVCYFTFGRFQPPTIGHGDNFAALKRAAGKEDYRIYISQKVTKNGTDPLEPDRKLYYMNKAFPEHRGKIISEQRGVIPICQQLMMEGYTDVIHMVGSDQVPNFQWVLPRNGIDFSFRTYEIQSTGKRDADGDTFAISGTKMRRAAFAGDFGAFRKGIPKPMNDRDCLALMKEIKIALPKNFT